MLLEFPINEGILDITFKLELLRIRNSGELFILSINDIHVQLTYILLSFSKQQNRGGYKLVHDCQIVISFIIGRHICISQALNFPNLHMTTGGSNVYKCQTSLSLGTYFMKEHTCNTQRLRRMTSLDIRKEQRTIWA